MGTFVQWAQLGVASAQLGELRGLHAQLQAQQDVRRQQALLADILFRTEQRAKQLSVVAGQDALVAAMFAEEWLTSVSRVGPELFAELDHKRAWSASASRLQSLTAPLEDPGARTLVQQVRAATAEAQRIQQGYGAANPEQRLAALQYEQAALTAQKAQASRRAMIWGGLSVGLPVAILILGAIVSAILPSGKKGTVEVDFGCLGSLGFLFFIGLGIGAAVQVVTWSDRGTKLDRLSDGLRQLSAAVAQMQAFSADPSWGGLLSRFYAEHPAYGRPLPNMDDAAPLSTAAPVVSSHIVERQTVVVRCKYCKTLTPVDAPTCQHCGAGGFAA